MNRKWLVILITLLSFTFFSKMIFAASDPCTESGTAFNNICYDHDISYRLIYELFAPNPSDMASAPPPWPFVKNPPQLPQSTGGGDAPTNVIMSRLFRTFNQAMLPVAGIIILYTLFTTLIGATQRGEFMGGKSGSMWLPVRSVVGFIMLIPTASGYSLIQLCLLWVILQGASLANTLSQAILQKPTLPTPHTDPASFSYRADGSTLMGDIACVYDKYYPLQRSVSLPLVPATQLPTLQENKFHCTAFDDLTDKNKSGYSFNFWYDNSGDTPVLTPCCRTDATASNCSGSRPPATPPATQTSVLYRCGSVTWPQSATYSLPAPQTGTFTVDTGTPISGAYRTIIQKAFDSAYAKIQYENGDSDTDPPPPFRDTDITQIFTAAMNTITAEIASHLPASGNTTGSNGNDAGGSITTNEGWASAGAYFYQTLLGKNIAGSGNAAPPPPSFVNLQAVDVDTSKMADGIVNPTLLPFLQTFGQSSDAPPGTNPAQQFAIEIFRFAMNILSPPPTAGGIIGMSSTHPIMRIQILGQYIISILTVVLAAGAILTFVLSIPTHIATAFSPAWGIFDALLRMAVAPIEILAGITYGAAITMSIYIPMIPYIIFSFGVLSWLVAVFETLLAAPLVAMGITYPEGHEMWGKADPALMLTINVFLRPSFMIFGLFGAVLISQIAIWFINDTLTSFILGLLSNPGTLSGGGFVGFIVSLLLMPFYIAVYVVIVITILNKSFALIAIIPDQVLRWIGGQLQLGESFRAEQEVKQGVSPVSEGVGRRMGAAGGAAHGGMDSAGKGYQEGKKLKAESRAGSTSVTTTPPPAAGP